MSALYEISGRCHCGNIEFEFTSPLQKTELPIRTCDCSFCTRQGACYTSHPQGRLAVRIKDRAMLQTYRFGSESADAYICRRCGVYPFIASELDGTMYAVLNANSINGLHIDRAIIPPAQQFSDQTEEERKARWKRAWIGHVEITFSGQGQF
ncbi:MAG: hypothetical protein RQ754_04180 [Desulfuromonadales bacterium]|nr:hypothetical protein [Desulfuromonadales bacterium]